MKKQTKNTQVTGNSSGASSEVSRHGVVKRLGRADVLEPYRMQRIAKDGRMVEVWLTATALVNEAGQVYAIATTERERGLETGQPGSKE